MSPTQITRRMKTHDTEATVPELPIDIDEIQTTIRTTLDRLPDATTAEPLLLSLRGHIQLLLPEIEAKDWERHGQGMLMRFLTESVREKLTEEPVRPVVARCLYAQQLARVCRSLLHFAQADPETVRLPQQVFP
ncbi:DUF6415 family natural product biosynthesis protein [Streptomyces orinoci]|uniref:DUF6415 family natural product biosynthesis protein n=1 Tax=Streptomyces orinoci TaxID=67339 RepID=A0ABV3JUR5_STRON|nr:DUF6415 family natural product biosynthesis protein [Streptomyces orinoci]